jgi:NAD(P)-dependent dehydrogenase (short-subunit alcohol dehydrogenase family)
MLISNTRKESRAGLEGVKEGCNHANTAGSCSSDQRAASGLGQALAESLAVGKCHPALVDVDDIGLQETAKKLASTERHISCHQTDVSKKEQMERLPDEILRVHQHVDILINNAGVALAGAFETGKAKVLVGRDTFMLVEMLFSRSAG